MEKKQMVERLKKVVRELAEINNEDDDFLLTIEEDNVLCKARRELRRIIERMEGEE